MSAVMWRMRPESSALPTAALMSATVRNVWAVVPGGGGDAAIASWPRPSSSLRGRPRTHTFSSLTRPPLVGNFTSALKALIVPLRSNASTFSTACWSAFASAVCSDSPAFIW
jgi:hypothetical protein